MLYTVTVSREGDRRGHGDPELTAALAELGAGPDAVGWRDDVYFLAIPDACSVLPAQIETFAAEFLAGCPTRQATVREGITFPDARRSSVILVLRKPGVMDPVESSVRHALRDAGIPGDECGVRTARRYRVRGFNAGRDTLRGIATGTLANLVVDDVHCFLPGETGTADPFQEFAGQPPERVEIPIRDLDDAGLERISAEGGLSLKVEEMHAIQEYFGGLGRNPTDVELETLAQTWSEHCCHKTLTGPIDYGDEKIENLLRETIFAVTEELDPSYCLSVFKDNAGVIAIDEQWALTFKVETHNHPSALEPYGGAGTGIGGVIRDTLGTGLGARPVLSTDVFCFGPLDAEADHVPAGSLHPRRLLQGVVAGVRDYGNRMGIPTANGAIVFHPGYIGNPLVFCGSVGLIPRDRIDKKVNPGDLIVAMGGRTGRDGIHGATFSSRELTEESETISAGAVQIGNPIEEKKVLDALLRARDEGLYRGLTDCGAGGFSSAVGEMGEEVGADVDLSRAPLKYEGLSPAEIWISEAQERMVLAVPPENQKRLFEIFAEEEVEGCVLGHFTGDGMLRLRYRDNLVGEMSMEFLHDGRPRLRKVASPAEPVREVEIDLEGGTPDDVLTALLSHPTIASKEPVIRQYDHEVQGRMVIRPLVGPDSDAPGDACAFDPFRDGSHTVVVGCGLAIPLGAVDPYQMGAQSVDEAVRNVIATGGSLERLSLLDNFAWGNVDDPEILGTCIECARGAADAARAYRAPFISGKDSLHNTYRAGGVSRSIPHTLLVSAVSIVEGPPRGSTSDLKKADSVLFLLGPPKAGLPGSFAQLVYGGVGGTPELFDRELGPRVARWLERQIASGSTRSVHDLSEGGLAVAAAEMAMGGGGLGLRLDLETLGDDAGDAMARLYGEAPHRFLVEVSPEVADGWGAEDVPLVRLGTATDDGRLRIRQGDRPFIDRSVPELHDIWKAPLFDVWRSPE